MNRKQFIKKLSLSTLSLPMIISCNKENSPTKDGDPNHNSGDTSEDCISTASETAGPFPIKDPSSLKRLDIRGDRTGVLLDVEITILDKTNDCLPLENVFVDIWHCDKDGYYSEYGNNSLQQEDFTDNHFLRGRQITDANGKVAFTTIFPGWYPGRSTHFHIEILDENEQSLLITQIAFPEGSDSAVQQVNTAEEHGYKGMKGYTYNNNDGVFADGVATELANISGSIKSGFSLVHSIVLST